MLFKNLRYLCRRDIEQEIRCINTTVSRTRDSIENRTTIECYFHDPSFIPNLMHPQQPDNIQVKEAIKMIMETLDLTFHSEKEIPAKPKKVSVKAR